MKKEATDLATAAEKVQAVIRCTPENAGEMRALVQRWPELNALVKGLQAQGLFPGLRALQIRLTGDEKTLAKGLAGVMAQNAPEAAKGENSQQGPGQ